MNISSSDTHTATTNADSRQTTRQGQELTHVRRFLAAARVCVRGGRGAGVGRVKAAVAVIVAALLAGGFEERRAGISRFLGRGQPHRCPPPGSGAHRAVTHRTMPTSLAVLAGASLVASLLAVPLAAPVSAQNYAVTPQAEFEDCWDHMEPPERYTLGDENGDAITVEGTTGVVTARCVVTWDGYLTSMASQSSRLSAGIAGSLSLITKDHQTRQSVHQTRQSVHQTRQSVRQTRQSVRRPYYVWKPQALSPELQKNPDLVIVLAPSTPPPVPANTKWQNGGLKNGTTTSDDQYSQGDDGYHRRKKQPDGTFRCYFNGYDGSLANLGAC